MSGFTWFFGALGVGASLGILLVLNTNVNKHVGISQESLHRLQERGKKILTVLDNKVLYNQSCEYNVLNGDDFDFEDEIFIFNERTKYGTQAFCYKAESLKDYVEANGSFNPLTRAPFDSKTRYTLRKYKDILKLTQENKDTYHKLIRSNSI